MRKYGAALFITALLAGSGFAAAGIAGLAARSGALVTTGTNGTVTLPTTTVGTTGAKPGKVTICHHTRGKGGTHHVTISVSERAWPAHQRHGDTLGPCDTDENEAVHSSASHAAKFHKQAKAKKAKKQKAEKAKAKKQKAQKSKGKAKKPAKTKPAKAKQSGKSGAKSKSKATKPSKPTKQKAKAQKPSKPAKSKPEKGKPANGGSGKGNGKGPGKP